MNAPDIENQQENNQPSWASCLFTPCITFKDYLNRHQGSVKTACFVVTLVNSVVQTMWASRKIYGVDERLIFGLMSSTNFIYMATFSYACTNFCKGADALLRPPEEKAPEEKSTRLETVAKVFPFVVAIMSNLALLASCLDSKDSVVGDLISNDTDAKIVGGIVAFFACIGDFYARVHFYIKPVAHNSILIKDDISAAYQNQNLTKHLATILFFIGLASGAYSLFYKLYLYEAMETFENDFGISADLSDYRIYFTMISIFFAVGNNFLGTYKKFCAILSGFANRDFTLLYSITNKKGEPLERNVLGTIGQLAGAVDSFCTMYSAMRLTEELHPALEWPLKFGVLCYGVGSYFGFSVNQGSALGLWRFEEHVKQSCCPGFLAQNAVLEDQREDLLSQEEQAAVDITLPSQSRH